MRTEFGGVALAKWPLMNEIATVTQSLTQKWILILCGLPGGSIRKYTKCIRQWNLVETLVETFEHFSRYPKSKARSGPIFGRVAEWQFVMGFIS